MTQNRASIARKELDLLSQTGLGIAPIAPALARLLSNIVGADACLIAWYGENGVPQGFFHDTAPLNLQELFLNNYRELFVGPNEFNIFEISQQSQQPVGNMLNPTSTYFKSNTFNLLIKPCRHHFSLDARVNVHGVTRIGLALFRSELQPFYEADAHVLKGLIPVLQRAVTKGSTGLGLVSTNEGMGHLLVSKDGQSITLRNERAAYLLRLAKLFDQDVRLVGHEASPPQFIKRLCSELAACSMATAAAQIDVVGGTLAINASWMTPMAPVQATQQDLPASLASDQISVTLELQRSVAVDVVRGISALGLSPLQNRIALFAVSGGSRMACAAHHGVSAEALKKHLREIYAASNCADWLELAASLKTPTIIAAQPH